MSQRQMRAVMCAVCGAQTNYHAKWFLVAENRWLDRLKVLSWHPALASQEEMQSVCGEEHLKVLIQHWLLQGNLNLRNGRKAAPIVSEYVVAEESASIAVGSMLGELAVDRNPWSRVWTGSAQTLDCIVSAITGRENAQAPGYSVAPLHAEQLEELAYSHSAGQLQVR
jgi:hypothetical protein